MELASCKAAVAERDATEHTAHGTRHTKILREADRQYVCETWSTTASPGPAAADPRGDLFLVLVALRGVQGKREANAWKCGYAGRPPTGRVRFKPGTYFNCGTEAAKRKLAIQVHMGRK
jgi:hypothetical protein